MARRKQQRGQPEKPWVVNSPVDTRSVEVRRGHDYVSFERERGSDAVKVRAQQNHSLYGGYLTDVPAPLLREAVEKLGSKESD
jgi:hypothetical protein